MRLTVNIPQFGKLASPVLIRDVAQMIEDLGFDGVAFGDHLAVPRVVRSKYVLGSEPMPIPDGSLKAQLAPFYECLSTMAFVAGMTRRVRLQSGVLVLPLRDPVYNARQIATIDALSGGRIDLGVGPGWMQEEADAVNMPWAQRGARTDEHIRVLRTLWESDDEYVSFNGRYYHFDEIDPSPHPHQRPLPIYIGGHTKVAKRRAGLLGDGWITWLLPADEQASGMAEIREVALAAGRDPENFAWIASIAPRYANSEVEASSAMFEQIDAYRKVGVTEMRVKPRARSADDMMSLIRWIGDEVRPYVRGA